MPFPIHDVFLTHELCDQLVMSVTRSENENRFMYAFYLSTLVQNMNVLLHKVGSEKERREMILSFSNDRTNY